MYLRYFVLTSLCLGLTENSFGAGQKSVPQLRAWLNAKIAAKEWTDAEIGVIQSKFPTAMPTAAEITKALTPDTAADAIVLDSARQQAAVAEERAKKAEAQVEALTTSAGGGGAGAGAGSGGGGGIAVPGHAPHALMTLQEALKKEKKDHADALKEIAAEKERHSATAAGQAAAKAHVSALESQLHTSQREIEKLQKAIKDIASSAGSDVAATALLNAQVTSLREDVAAKDGTIAAHAATIAGHETRIETLTKEKDAAQAERDAARAGSAAKDTEIAAREATIAAREATIAGHVATIRTLTGERDAAQADSTAKDGTIAAHVATIATREATIAGHETRIETLTKEKDAAQAERDAARAGSAAKDTEIAAREATIAGHVATIAGHETRIETLTKEKDAAQAERDAARAENTALKADLSGDAALKESLDRATKEAEAARKKHQEQLEKYQAEKEALERRHASELRALREQLATFQSSGSTGSGSGSSSGGAGAGAGAGSGSGAGGSGGAGAGAGAGSGSGAGGSGGAGAGTVASAIPVTIVDDKATFKINGQNLILPLEGLGLDTNIVINGKTRTIQNTINEEAKTLITEDDVRRFSMKVYNNGIAAVANALKYTITADDMTQEIPVLTGKNMKNFSLKDILDALNKPTTALARKNLLVSVLGNSGITVTREKPDSTPTSSGGFLTSIAGGPASLNSVAGAGAGSGGGAGAGAGSGSGGAAVEPSIEDKARELGIDLKGLSADTEIRIGGEDFRIADKINAAFTARQGMAKDSLVNMINGAIKAISGTGSASVAMEKGNPHVIFNALCDEFKPLLSSSDFRGLEIPFDGQKLSFENFCQYVKDQHDKRVSERAIPVLQRLKSIITEKKVEPINYLAHGVFLRTYKGPIQDAINKELDAMEDDDAEDNEFLD